MGMKFHPLPSPEDTEQTPLQKLSFKDWRIGWITLPCYRGPAYIHSATPLGSEDDRGDEIPSLVPSDMGEGPYPLADP